MNKPEGKENVFDVIDDAAQVLFKMTEGIYYDEKHSNIITITKSSGTIKMILAHDDVRFTVECVEDDDHMGKITSITIQETNLYTSRGVAMTRYDRGILGERGRLMMHRLIEKLQTCVPYQQANIRTEVQRKTTEIVRETTSPVVACEHLGY